MNLYIPVLCLSLLPFASVADGTGVVSVLSRSVLPSSYSTISARAAYNLVAEADIAADAAWEKVSGAGAAAVAAHRRLLRERMISAIGGFPEKTPLNAVVKPSWSNSAYTVENVLFESSPGVYVTGNFYRPNGGNFKPPYPAVLVALGHSIKGKGARGYQHTCVLLAKAGFASFICDPIEQGERFQPPGDRHNCSGHNQIGVRAALLGWSMARFRMWDGIRAIDYMVSRPDVDSSRIAMMGQSGGGTMTALLMAVDERIRTAAPSCYISNLRSVCARQSPQDAEQNIFGQLDFGLNHLGLVLLRDIPVLLAGRYQDFFPYQGTLETLHRARAFNSAAGGGANCTMAFAPGPHGWCESTCSASVDWIRRHLLDGDRGSFSMSDFLHLDTGFSYDDSDNGIPEPHSWCANGGQISNLPGYRSVYAVMSEQAKKFEGSRTATTLSELAKCALRRARIRMPGERGLRIVTADGGRCLGAKVEYVAFHDASGYAFAGTLFIPGGSSAKDKPPLIAVSQHGRADVADIVGTAVVEGRTVLAVDVFGLGEIGRKEFNFYEISKVHPEEAAAVSLYLVGESAVGWQAGDLLAAADYLKGRFGQASMLYAKGSPSIAAAHARAVGGALISSVAIEDAPLSWSEALQTPTAMYPFANIVNGAFADYDWIDLLK